MVGISTPRGDRSSNTRGMAAGPHRRPPLEIACHDPVRVAGPPDSTVLERITSESGDKALRHRLVAEIPLTGDTFGGSSPYVTGPSAERNAHVKWVFGRKKKGASRRPSRSLCVRRRVR